MSEQDSGRHESPHAVGEGPWHRVLSELAAGGHKITNASGGVMAQCPSHADTTPSLSIKEGDDGRVLLYCFAGCETETIVAALGLTMADLFAPKASGTAGKSGRANGRAPRVAEREYLIRDADGTVVARHVRVTLADGSKEMFWRGPNGERGLGGRKVVTLPLYNTQSLRDRPDEPVVIVEGEKAADSLILQNVLALGTVTGASGGKMPKAPARKVLEVLKGRHVVLWPDHDKVGSQHMITMARALRDIAASVRLASPVGVAESGDDACDLIDEMREKHLTDEDICDVLNSWFEGAKPLDTPELKSQPGVESATCSRPSLVHYHYEPGDTPLHMIVPQVIQKLALRPDLEVYVGVSAGVLVHVVGATNAPAARKGTTRSSAPRVRELDRSVLREVADAVAQFIRVGWSEERQVEEWKETLAPKPIVDALHARGYWPGIRPLVAVVTAPVMRPDGSVLDQAGYDAATRLFYAPMREYPPVPADPTDEDVASAVLALQEPFEDFPTATNADRGTILAMMLSIAARPAIAGPVPGTLSVAPTVGSGKTLLFEAITAAMTGHGPDILMWPGGRQGDSDAEMRKRIGALAVDAPAVAIIDNVPDGCTLASPALAAALTAERLTERRLGSSENMREPLRIIWGASGNNITLPADLSRRFLSVLLDPKCEAPHLRTGFRIPRLAAYVREHHPRLLTAALTLLRAFVNAGRPQHRHPKLGSYEAWDELVRAAVIWATGVDPVETQARLRSESPEVSAHAALVDAWLRHVGADRAVGVTELLSGPYREGMAQQMVVACTTRDGLPPSPVVLGKYLHRMAGRVAHGHRIEKHSSQSGSSLWVLRAVTGRAT